MYFRLFQAFLSGHNSSLLLEHVPSFCLLDSVPTPFLYGKVGGLMSFENDCNVFSTQSVLERGRRPKCS